MSVCSYEDKISNCQRPVKYSGLCGSHGDHRNKYGELRPILKDIPKRFIFMQYVLIKPGLHGCWEWLGAISDTGYGAFQTGSGLSNTHRYSWEKVNGSIPKGKHIDHLCHNRACVNVDHLRLVTPTENNENHNGATKTSTTGIRGVYTNSKGVEPYRVQIRSDGKYYYGGYFTDLGEAEQAAKDLRNRLFTHNDKDR